MTSFSKSTILGLVFGMFLAGYAVFAFTPPTQSPTAGNVPAPINVGSDPQVKSGGLWVGSLGVGGGSTFGGALNLQGNKITNVGAPTAAGDAATKGFVDAIATRHIQGGLYGHCLVRFLGNSYPVACQSRLEPATCTIESQTPWVRIDKCGCSAGYTIVLTGEGDNPNRPARMYACYKN